MDADGERGARVCKIIADQIGYTGACQVRLTHELESPVSFGIRNPIILFPSKYYEQLSESELHTTLLHELSHIKNHDPLRILLIKVIESLFFFQPLVWLASSRMYYLSELVADDSVLEAGVGAGCYANTIVNLIELGSEPSHQYKLSTGIFSSPRMLVARMEHLLDDTCGHRTKLVGKSLFASSLVLIIALTVTVQFSPRSSALGNTANGGMLCLFACLCVVWQQRSGETLIDFSLGVMVFAYSGLLAVFLTALFTRRGNTASAVAALATGFITVALMQPAVWTRWAPGLGIDFVPAFPWRMLVATALSFGVCVMGKRARQESHVP